MTPILLAALALQTVSLADLQSEAERHGRLAAAVGYCTLMGYAFDDQAMSTYVEDFHARASAGGMTPEDIEQFVSAGAAREIETVRLQGEETSMAPAERRAQTIRTINGIKASCKAVATGEFSGVIGGLEQGDAVADAMLAEMLTLIDSGG
jgi:hypothetical protein